MQSFASPFLALARATFADSLRQGATWLATGISLVLMAATGLFGMFTFVDQDRIRLVLTAGVAVQVLNGLFLGVVLASNAIHEELASRTALNLLAKPVGRGTFLFAKAAGAFAVVVASGLILAVAHLGLLALLQHHGFYDPSPAHAHHHDAEGLDVWLPYGRVLAAQVLALASAGVMTSLASALALRLNLVLNVLTCFAVFVLAHVAAGFGWPRTGLLPVLALCNLDEGLQFQDLPLRPPYFLLSILHASLYSAGSLILGLALFRRRDLA